MKSLFTLAVLASVLNLINALPPVERDVDAQITVVGPGCTWCSTPLAWTTDQGMLILCDQLLMKPVESNLTQIVMFTSILL
jgi:hypothetical protein